MIIKVLKNTFKLALLTGFVAFITTFLLFGAILQTSERIESYELSQAVNGD